MPTFLSVLLVTGALWFPPQDQVNASPKPDRSTVSSVEEPPQFPGGDSKLTEYIRKNLRYPKTARKARLEGQISVNFIVTDEGHIADVKLFNSLGLGTDEEAIRLVESMPNWIPGRKGGKAVNTHSNVTINFTLK